MRPSPPLWDPKVTTAVGIIPYGIGPRRSPARSTGPGAGSSDSVTNMLIVTSQDCAHDCPAGLAPPSAVPQREHCAGVLALIPVRITGHPRPGCGRQVRHIGHKPQDRST